MDGLVQDVSNIDHLSPLPGLSAPYGRSRHGLGGESELGGVRLLRFGRGLLLSSGAGGTLGGTGVGLGGRGGAIALRGERGGNGACCYCFVGVLDYPGEVGSDAGCPASLFALILRI